MTVRENVVSYCNCLETTELSRVMQHFWTTNTTGHLGYDQQIPGSGQHTLPVAADVAAAAVVGGGVGGEGGGEPQQLRDVRHRHHQ